MATRYSWFLTSRGMPTFTTGSSRSSRSAGSVAGDAALSLVGRLFSSTWLRPCARRPVRIGGTQGIESTGLVACGGGGENPGDEQRISHPAAQGGLDDVRERHPGDRHVQL